MGLDVGDRRIGVAISDPSHLIAAPLTTVHRTAEKQDHQLIADLVSEHEVERVVVGLPTTLRGEAGHQAQRVMNFGQRLSAVLQVPLVYWDERHSTADAERIVRARGRRRGRPKRQDLDDVAAAVILQSYLNSVPRASLSGTEESNSGLE